LVPPYLTLTRNIEELLPWLYLRGIPTCDFSETLKHLLGADAQGLSAATISRLKQDWKQDYQDWTRRDLSQKRSVYVRADGVSSPVRMDDTAYACWWLSVLMNRGEIRQWHQTNRRSTAGCRLMLFTLNLTIAHSIWRGMNYSN
jgi:transposase-like protein